jgi:hypothetical protein
MIGKLAAFSLLALGIGLPLIIGSYHAPTPNPKEKAEQEQESGGLTADFLKSLLGSADGSRTGDEKSASGFAIDRVGPAPQAGAVDH